MIVTPATLAAIANRAPNANMIAVVAGLQTHPAGLQRPARLARFLGHTCEESGGWIYDHELGAPAYFKRYDGRPDLGNTHPGDGERFKGRTGMQITGRGHYREYTQWARGIDPHCPDFEADPDTILTDPWEGLGPVWYWDTHIYHGMHINYWADKGDDLAVTHAINGGENGLAERLRYTALAGVQLCGFYTVKAFQSAHMLAPDGDAGALTFGVMHKALTALPDAEFRV